MTPDAKIPEGIPTGVVATPVAATPASTPSVTTEQTPAVPTEGMLDRAVKAIVKFVARLMGKPDPITGEAPAVKPATKVEEQAATFADKVWATANKVVEKASDVATKATDVAANAVETTRTTVNQAVEGVQEVKADITATQTPATPAPTQPLETLEQPK